MTPSIPTPKTSHRSKSKFRFFQRYRSSLHVFDSNIPPCFDGLDHAADLLRFALDIHDNASITFIFNCPSLCSHRGTCIAGSIPKPHTLDPAIENDAAADHIHGVHPPPFDKTVRKNYTMEPLDLQRRREALRLSPAVYAAAVY